MYKYTEGQTTLYSTLLLSLDISSRLNVAGVLVKNFPGDWCRSLVVLAASGGQVTFKN
jgi:hypothetical protein